MAKDDLMVAMCSGDGRIVYFGRLPGGLGYELGVEDTDEAGVRTTLHLAPSELGLVMMVVAKVMGSFPGEMERLTMMAAKDLQLFSNEIDTNESDTRPSSQPGEAGWVSDN